MNYICNSQAEVMHELSKDHAYLRKDKFTICIYDVYTTFCIVYCTQCTVYTTYSANIKMPAAPL